jgi:outer membrane lipoprotein-sorting protein
MAFGLTVALAIAAPSGAARAQSGIDILKRSMQTYQRLATYKGTSSVSVSMLYNGKPVQTNYDQVELRMRRPNMITIIFTNPSGTRAIYDDGTTMYVYGAALNQYNRIPAQKTLQGELVMLGAIGVQASLDPLYFFVIGKVPETLSSVNLVGTVNLNGKSCYYITGGSHAPAHKARMPNGKIIQVPATSAKWKWWIEKSTLLLVKIEAIDPHVPMKVGLKKGKKVTQTMLIMAQRVSNTVLEATPNANLPDNAFQFAPPPGATERKSIGEILKSGK